MGRLTGKYFHKKTFCGMVLMVEVEIFYIHSKNIFWRKAKDYEIKLLNL